MIYLGEIVDGERWNLRLGQNGRRMRLWGFSIGWFGVVVVTFPRLSSQ